MSSGQHTKYYETSYLDYVKSFNRHNIHPELDQLRQHLPHTISELPNIIIYGPGGSGRYTQALSIISKYSPSQLRYEQKIYINYEKQEKNTSVSICGRITNTPDDSEGVEDLAEYDMAFEEVSDIDTSDDETTDVDSNEDEEELINIKSTTHVPNKRKTTTIKPKIKTTKPSTSKVKPPPISKKKQIEKKTDSQTKKKTSTESTQITIGKARAKIGTLPVQHTPSSRCEKKNGTTQIKRGSNDFVYHISDIHYEIDMPSLGCNAKFLWHELFHHIIDIVMLSPSRSGIILCKNFHLIHNELLAVFYSYMHHPVYHQYNIHLRFVLISEHVCFLPNDILDSCHIVSVRRPSLESYKSIVTTEPTITPNSMVAANLSILDAIDLTTITNIKEVYGLVRIQSVSNIPEDMFVKITAPLYTMITNPNEIDIYALRTKLYNLLIFNIDVYETIWYIFSRLIEDGHIHNKLVLKDMFVYFRHYNNNYRSIYHLERIFLSIRSMRTLHPN